MMKKYVLLDFYENEFGELIATSDRMDDIKKSVKQHRKDTDGECLLICLQSNDDAKGFTQVF